MSRKPRIAVVGSANVDLTTFSDTFPRPGETLFGKSFHLGFGGRARIKRSLARLCGADVVMVANVGNDLFGGPLSTISRRSHRCSRVRIVDGVSSGVAPIFVEPNRPEPHHCRERRETDTLKPADVDAAATALRSVDTIVLQFEIPLDTVA